MCILLTLDLPKADISEMFTPSPPYLQMSVYYIY